MTIGHINVDRLSTPSHYNLLNAKNSTHYYDVIAITETFLTHEQTENHLTLPDFTLNRHDRQGKSGGGVALYVRNRWEYKPLAFSIQKNPTIFENKAEYLISELKQISQAILVAVVYRRPKAATPIDLFKDLANLIPKYKICRFYSRRFYSPNTSRLQHKITRNLTLH